MAASSWVSGQIAPLPDRGRRPIPDGPGRGCEERADRARPRRLPKQGYGRMIAQMLAMSMIRGSGEWSVALPLVTGREATQRTRRRAEIAERPAQSPLRPPRLLCGLRVGI